MAPHRYSFQLCFAAIALALSPLGACSGLPHDVTRTVMMALESPTGTAAGIFIDSELQKHPGQSGFILLASGDDAFSARTGAAAIAERTIDAQYYIWDADTVGKLLINELILAADRGVRVRLLLDDYLTAGKDQGIAIVDDHPNIEIRIFNPFRNRVLRQIDLVTDFIRVNRRMHNKAFITDNAVAVVGGRNIADHYFGVSPDAYFRDLDVLAIGPVVEDVSRSFDIFWNSVFAVPIGALVDFDITPLQREERIEALRRWSLSESEDFPYKVFRDREDRIARLHGLRDRFVWCEAEVLFDDPTKAGGSGESGIAPRLRQVIGELESELMIESAYFIPGRQGVRLLGELERRGVDVRVLTNSLASNNEPLAFSGYARYRVPLVTRGVELHELRVDPGNARRDWPKQAVQAKATLHTKALVFDRRKVFLGSMNLDPRSININTEIGLLIDCVPLSKQVAARLEDGMGPDWSYELSLNEKPESQQVPLIWKSRIGDAPVRHDYEPDTGLAYQIYAWFLSLLPIEKQL